MFKEPSPNSGCGNAAAEAPEPAAPPAAAPPAEAPEPADAPEAPEVPEPAEPAEPDAPMYCNFTSTLCKGYPGIVARWDQ